MRNHRQVKGDATKKSAAKQARHKAIAQRQKPQIRSAEFTTDIEHVQRERARPICLDLPGMAGGSWSDEELLRYVCRVFVSSTAQRLLKGIAANKIERFCSVVDFVDFHCVIRTVAARQQPLERMAFNRLAGLGSWRTSSNRQVLENVCITIHNLREPLMAALQNFPETEALPFAEALLIAEAVSHRAGYHTELDETPFTAIERWAKDLTTRVAKDTLADIVSCVAVPAAS